MDQNNWHELKEIFARKFGERSQREWEGVFDGTDSCVTPVIPLSVEDNRPVAGLRGSPGLDVGAPKGDALKPGSGMENALQSWMGWSRGREYNVDGKGIVRLAGSAKF
jgi:alpha-methylacyl-CoA racemase